MRGSAWGLVRGTVLVALGAACTQAPLAAPPSGTVAGTCELTVQGRRYIHGRCEIDLQPDGSFTMRQQIGGRLTWFAVVSISGPGRADGFWNEDRGANHAHTPLGGLRRQGACWLNGQARLCARRAAVSAPVVRGAGVPQPRLATSVRMS